MANQSIFYHLRNKAMPMTMAMPVSSKPGNSSASKLKPVQSTAHIKTNLDQTELYMLVIQPSPNRFQLLD